LKRVTFQGMINKDNFNGSAFGSELWTKYYAANGGIGTYINTSTREYYPEWTKQ